METILYNISQVIGVAVIHSLWQGLVVYLFLRLILLSFSAMPAKAKHNIAMLSLLGLTTWFIYTLVGEVRVYQWVELKANATNYNGFLPAILNMPLHLPHSTTYSSRYYYTVEGLLPYITLIYVAGLMFNASKLALTRKKLGDIKQTVSIDIALMRRVAEFAEKLDIERRVHFGLSNLVDVPCMFGYVKPFILLPMSITTSLSTEEIEAILMHELAHIKRNDYLANLGQQAMSVLLFFNPFAQLIDRIINRERENACDDIVIESTQKPIVYAHALLKLEESRTQQWQIALAATGKKKYQLLNRIERIMKTKKPIGNTRHILIAFVVLTASITGLAWLNPTIAHGKISFNKIKPAVIAELFSDTTHKKPASKTAHKTAAVKHTTKAKHSTYYSDDFDTHRDPKLEALSAELSKYGEQMSKYYESPEWKKYQEQLEVDGKKLQEYYDSPEWKKVQQDMEEQGKKIEAYYDSPQWKEMMANQQKLSESFGKNWGETGETKEWGEKMGQMGHKIEKYYNSDEFKALNEKLETKYGIPHNRRYYNNDEDRKDENYRKYQDELNQHIPADVRQATDELKTLGEKMRDHWNNPEMRKQQEEMRLMGDSIRKMSNNESVREAQRQMRLMSEQMRKYQNSPEMKKVQEEMRAAGAKMRAYQNSPEMKKIQEQMRAAQAKMREYMRSPEFRKNMEAWRNMNYNMNFRWDDSDRMEKPEKPEKPEKLEKSDKPEKPEAPEKPEKPDTTSNQ